MSSEASEKTEQPSEFKLREARKKGQVAKSADIAALASLFFALMVLMLFFTLFMKRLFGSWQGLFSNGFNTIDNAFVEKNVRFAFESWLVLSMPILLAAGLGAVIGNLSQFGFLFSTHPIKFDLKKIDPISGTKKLFSKNRLMELLKQLIKFTVVFLVIFYAVRDALPNLSMLFRVELLIALAIIGDLLQTIFVRVLLCFLMIAILDFFWQRFSFLKSMRMSKYEVKKEYIQQEGDPELKHERKRVQQETLEAISTSNVKDASVIITNPSHLAVALRYNEQLDEVPRVISKGVGRMAKLIISEAKSQNIPIMRNVPLARDLQWLEINEEIPQRLYDSVAEVLTFISDLNAKHSENHPNEN